MCGLRGDNFISGPQGISWSGFSVKKIRKEIFLKISEKIILLFFLYWKFQVFLKEIWHTLDVFVKAEQKKNNTKY